MQKDFKENHTDFESISGAILKLNLGWRVTVHVGKVAFLIDLRLYRCKVKDALVNFR